MTKDGKQESMVNLQWECNNDGSRENALCAMNESIKRDADQTDELLYHLMKKYMTPHIHKSRKNINKKPFGKHKLQIGAKYQRHNTVVVATSDNICNSIITSFAARAGIWLQLERER